MSCAYTYMLCKVDPILCSIPCVEKENKVSFDCKVCYKNAVDTHDAYLDNIDPVPAPRQLTLGICSRIKKCLVILMMDEGKIILTCSISHFSLSLLA